MGNPVDFKGKFKKISLFCLVVALIVQTFVLLPTTTRAAVASLPSPGSPLLVDDFIGGGSFGKSGSPWANWYNQSGGTGTYARTTVDALTVGKFTQTPASSSSQAKFEPQHFNANLEGYRYLNLSMKNPGYAGSRINISIEDGAHSYSLTNGFVSVPTSWTPYAFDLNLFPGLVKSSAHIVVWLNQATGVYGEMLLDNIQATDTYSGTAPTLTATGMTSNSGAINNENTLYTFAARYTDVDNNKPFAVQLVIDNDTVYDMTAVNMADITYTDGKDYYYILKLPVGSHSYYFRTTDNNSDVVTTLPVSGPTVVSATQIIDINDNTVGTGNNQMTYAGTGWSYSAAPVGNYQGDNHVSGTADDSLTFRFIGTKARLYGVTAATYGIAAVSIDGGADINVDTYSASRVESALLYTTPNLTNQLHTVKVRVTGQKNASSSGYTIAIDKINAETYTGSLVNDVVISQAGYSANAFKNAKVTAYDELSDTSYQVLNGSTVVASGNMTDEGVTWNKHVYSIDFSGVTTVGTNYTIKTNNISSYPFQIQSNIWNQYKDEMTAFYRLQRSAVDTRVSYPVGYSSDTAPSEKVFHPAGHLDDGLSPDGTAHYDLSGSWYDAGDYGKYGGNQWVAGEIALAYLRHASNANVRYDNDNNGVPDLIDEARFGSEYLVKFANAFGGAMYNLPNNAGFIHPEKETDNIINTPDDRKYGAIGIGGSAKAAGALAATARAIQSALAGGYIPTSKVAEFTTFAASCQTAAITFYNFVVANPNLAQGSYETIGGVPNTLLWAEVELYLLTNDTAYKNSATARISTLTFKDIKSTNYWDMRPMSMAEFYPVADTATQTIIHKLLKQQADYFLSSTDDTPYGVLNEFGPFGVNEPHAGFLGDMVRYYELFGDPAVLRAVTKGAYWIFGENPWNISWVSGIGTDYVDFLHTRLDENSYNTANTGVVIPGEMVSGPNMKDTKDKTSVSPWYEDRGLFADDGNQWRYNESSISIQVGLLYTIMGLTDLNVESTSGGVVPAKLPITSPIIGDYVRGNVTLFVQPTTVLSSVYSTVSDLVYGASYSPMTAGGGVYSTTVDVSSLAPYTSKRVNVRGTDSLGNDTYSSTHYTVAPPLPDPSHPLLYDDFSKNGMFGAQKLDWVNWWNQSGGTGKFNRVNINNTYDVAQFSQTPATSASQAKFEPWHDTVDLSGYRYLTYTMKNPGYANSQINLTIEDGASSFSLTSGFVSVPTTWTTKSYDLNAFPTLNKKTAHLVVWLKQATGLYGEMLLDDIQATNVASGSAPALTSTNVTPALGDSTTPFTFTATYTDADNQKPFAMEVIVDGVVHKMQETTPSDVTYTDGKTYSFTTKLPPGTHSYYFNTTDTTSDAVSTTLNSGPTVITKLFSDDFSSGLADNWTPTSGTWSVVNSEYNGTAGYGTSISTAGSLAWTNYTLQAKVKVMTNSGGNNDAGLVFRYTDPNNYYVLAIRNNNHPSGRKMELYKIVGGVQTPLGYAGPSTVANTDYTYKVVVNGSSIQAYQDGVLQLNISDNALSSGKIGARVYATSKMILDDVTVSQ
ncbi:hypothetical protein A8709_12995 [Paenibacillus pectinilyticus]|uniref:Uncharacterized protein n=1 Tax=Paenibacillus pectinilyticus TaxID=512399 RepID=A0A1C1A3H7_9BACL|nr:glycoside hydrolase family 9 protein [Paenibacillus pectinilyticus]OCT15030.1 hypothetical protein A8709_12995 [Paenibacillus pectinilyticus]